MYEESLVGPGRGRSIVVIVCIPREFELWRENARAARGARNAGFAICLFIIVHDRHWHGGHGCRRRRVCHLDGVVGSKEHGDCLLKATLCLAEILRLTVAETWCRWTWTWEHWSHGSHGSDWCHWCHWSRSSNRIFHGFQVHLGPWELQTRWRVKDLWICWSLGRRCHRLHCAKQVVCLRDIHSRSLVDHNWPVLTVPGM
mmetsp:Transcript_58803/g.128751  ORF Transcript_58803/g.128751 Transcript_58803/m.128751 type:complete len:200 (+) Transcript_58803:237-836(+)